MYGNASQLLVVTVVEGKVSLIQYIDICHPIWWVQSIYGLIIKCLTPGHLGIVLFKAFLHKEFLSNLAVRVKKVKKTF